LIRKRSTGEVARFRWGFKPVQVARFVGPIHAHDIVEELVPCLEPGAVVIELVLGRVHIDPAKASTTTADEPGGVTPPWGKGRIFQ